MTEGLHFSRRAAIVGAAGLAAFGFRNLSRAEGPVLRLLCWAGYDNGEATRSFTATTGTRVQADYIGANDEIFMKLRAGGIGAYDLVTPANGVIAPLVADALIQPLDLGRLASNSALLPQFQQAAWSTVNGSYYAAPYVWGTQPMVVATKETPPPAAWTDLLDKKFINKLILTNDSVSNIMIWNRALGAANPASVTVNQLNATIDTLLKLKRQYANAYTSDMQQIATRLAKGQSWISTTGWESVPVFPGIVNAGLQIARPNPGSFSFCDNLCLVQNAPNPDAAYAFIDHMRGADAQVILMNSMKRGTVNVAAVSRLEPYARGVYDYDHLDAFLERSPFYGFPPFDAEGDTATYVDWVNAWETITSARLGAGPTPTPAPTSTATSRATPVGRGTTQR